MLSDQEKAALQQQIKSNEHEIFILSIEEMDAIIRSSPKSQLSHVQKGWTEIKSKFEMGANFAASATDLNKLKKLLADLGSPNSKVYVKTYGGQPHIILKGYPGLRKVLTGTKYGIKNPQVIAMGLGQAGAKKVATSGGLLTVVLLTGYRVADYVLTDEATLSQLIGSLATDVVKVGITIGASLFAASVVGLTAVSTFAIGPLLVVIGVGLVATAGLNFLDEHLGITENLITIIDQSLEDSKRQINTLASDVMHKSVDYVLSSARRTFVNFAHHQLKRLTGGRPRALR